MNTKRKGYTFRLESDGEIRITSKKNGAITDVKNIGKTCVWVNAEVIFGVKE